MSRMGCGKPEGRDMARFLARAPWPNLARLLARRSLAARMAGMSTDYAGSPLCARHDGAMLGLLLFMCRFEFARERFPILRRRIQHLLDGIDAGVQVPGTHDEFGEGWSPLFEQVIDALTQSDGGVNLPLFRPFALGTGFLAVGMDMPNQTDVPTLTAIMETDLELPMSLLEEHAAAIPEIGDATSIDDVMSPAL